MRPLLSAVSASLLSAGLLLPAVPAAAAAPPARPLDRACPADRVSPTEFEDVATTTHRFAVECVVWWGVARGRNDVEYAPAAGVTRGQMATFLANTLAASGAPLPAATRDWFADDQGSPHEASTNKLREAEVVLGRADGSYGGDLPVTRAAMATYLVRTVERRTGKELTATRDWFADDAGDFHESRINQAAEVGLTGGSTSGDYRPADPVRRDQMASFLARTLDVLVEQAGAPLPARPPLPELALGGGFTGFSDGRPMDDAVRWLTARLGPPASTSRGVLCVGSERTGRRASWPGLTVQSGDDAVETDWGTIPGDTLEGWVHTGEAGAPRLMTAEGIALGSRVDAVRDAYPGEDYEDDGPAGAVIEVFLGDTSNLDLRVTGLAASDTVTEMSAGVACRPAVPQAGPVEAIAYWGEDVLGPDLYGHCNPPDPDGGYTGRWCFDWRHRGPDGDVYWAVQENAYEPDWELLVVPVEGGWSVTRVAGVDLGGEEPAPAWTEPAADSSPSDVPPECRLAAEEGTTPPAYC